MLGDLLGPDVSLVPYFKELLRCSMVTIHVGALLIVLLFLMNAILIVESAVGSEQL